MSTLIICLLVTALALPLNAQSGSGSGSGSGGSIPTGPPLSVLASAASLTQQQRDNVVAIGFTGISRNEFLQPTVIEYFSERMANIVNMNLFGTGRLMKRQQNLVTPQDVTVLDSTAMVGNVLMVEFVIGGHGGQGSPISNTQMAEILQTEGPRLAMDMSAATGLPVEFFGAMAVEQPQPESLSQAVIIGIVVGIVVAIVLITVLLTIVAVVCCIRAAKKKRKAKTSHYVEVSAEDGNSFSSKWTPMKVNTNGDYESVPNSFSGKSSGSSNNNTAL